MFSVLCLLNPHTHLREGEVQGPLVKLAVQGGARLLGAMPNTKDGLMTAASTIAYTSASKEAVPEGVDVSFVPIAQLTERTTLKQIFEWVASGIRDVKVYPKSRTTSAHHGVADYSNLLPLVDYCGKKGVRVHFHPEHPLSLIDNRDAEFLFIPVMDMFMRQTTATLIWEHATDMRCLRFWEEWAKTGRFFITVTAHHLLENETTAYGDVATACKPPPKTFGDMRGLVWLASQGYDWVMAGGDDAPHPIGAKHKIGPCACGAYTAPFLLLLYMHALFQGNTKLSLVEKFIHMNARELYGIDSEPEYISLKKEPFVIPNSYRAGPWEIEPFWAGRELDYSFA